MANFHDSADSRCHCLANNLQIAKAQIEGKVTDIVEVLRSVKGEIGRNKLRRVLDNPKKQWPEIVRQRLAADAAAFFGWSEPELFAYLDKGAEPLNREMVRLCHVRLFRENTSNLSTLAGDLQNRLADAKEIKAIHQRMPVGHTTVEFWEDVVRQGQMVQGFSDAAKEAKIDFGKTMRAFASKYRPANGFIFGLSMMSYEEMISCTGHCKGVDPRASADCVEAFGEEAVKDRKTSFLLFDDFKGQMPETSKAWVKQYALVLCIDSNFVMEVSRSGADRCFIERTGNPVNDALLDEKIRCINAVLAHPTHDMDDRAAVMKILDPHRVHYESEKKAIQDEHLAQMRRENPAPDDFEKRPLRVHFPRQ
jgi:hypothetical protein